MCTEKLFKRRCLYTQRLLRKENFTQTFIHTDALHKDAFARINKGTQALLHTEPFKTEKPLAQNSSYTTKLLRRKTLTQKNLCTQTQTPQRSFYTPKLLHAETLPRTTFTHRFFSAQKPLRTEVLMHSFFHSLHTDAFTQKTFTHRNLCTQHAFTHSQFLHREALLPLLHHLLSSSPSQVVSVKHAYCMRMTGWYNSQLSWGFDQEKVR